MGYTRIFLPTENFFEGIKLISKSINIFVESWKQFYLIFNKMIIIKN